MDYAIWPGNLVDSKLYKLGGVYQMVLWYAVVEQRSKTLGEPPSFLKNLEGAEQ